MPDRDWLGCSLIPARAMGLLPQESTLYTAGARFQGPMEGARPVALPLGGFTGLAAKKLGWVMGLASLGIGSARAWRLGMVRANWPVARASGARGQQARPIRLRAARLPGGRGSPPAGPKAPGLLAARPGRGAGLPGFFGARAGEKPPREARRRDYIRLFGPYFLTSRYLAKTGSLLFLAITN
jgi:hypothetical protein